MYLPDDGVQLLGDDGKLGGVSRRSGVIPDPQTFKAMFMLERYPGRAPGGAVDPKTTRSATVLIGVLLPTDVIRAKFVFCYSHAGDRSETGDKFRFPLELGKGGCKGLEVVCKAHVWGCVFVSVGFPESKAAVGVIFFKDREKDVEDRYPGERAAYVSLPTAHFCIEVESLQPREPVFEPTGE
jgi:hypothetical protein